MRANKRIGLVIGTALLVLTGPSAQTSAQAEVPVGLSVSPPPPLVIPAPPALALIPRTRVYLAPEIAEDLLFYRGWWYRPHGGHWFRARSYRGPWGFVRPDKVPRALVNLPPDYRQLPLEQRKPPPKKVKHRKEKEPSPPKIKKVKGTQGGPNDPLKGKKEQGPDGGPPENQRKSPGSYLKSTKP
jgi:hypothetical protein